MSEKKKQYWKDNPDKHPWKRSDKFQSKPCETAKQYLREAGIAFEKEFSPLQDRAFSVDIAFPEKKIAIEINGNQHYESDGSLKEYYRKRHDEITAVGWTVIEVHYTLAYDKTYIVSLYGNPVQRDYSIIFDRKKIKRDLAQQKDFERKMQIEFYRYTISKSSIDFLRFGWVGKVAEILQITPQKVNGWMKRNFPELLENCFHRKILFTS